MKLLSSLWQWIDERSGISAALGPIMRHPVPPGTGWKYVFGSATLLAFIVQVVTGVALATVYVSSASDAYQSLQFISHQATLGWLIRGIHYFGASAMILMVGIHMIRVYLTGSFKFPREMNWISGAVLLGATLAMGFTGQLLRWDQDGIWSTAIAAEQAGRVPFIGHLLARLIFGGDTVGGATLSRFFAIHVFLIPAVIFAFIGYHLYLVIHNGISEPPKAGHPVNLKTYRPGYEDLLRREGVPFWPGVAWRDVVFGLAMLCGIVILAGVFHAPELTKPPDPTILQAEPRPDWYLLWYYAVLAMSPHYMENYIMILGPLLAGTALILLPIIFNSGERSPSRRPWSIGIVILIVMLIGTMWVEGKRAPWSPDFNAQPLRARDSRNLEPAAQQGAALFFRQGCEYCHTIEGQGGERGPNLSTVADRLTAEQMTIRILNGGTNMPAFAGILKPDELTNILAFLATRHANSPRARSDAYPNHIQPALGRTFNTGAKPGITKAKALFRI